jgi:hypothetical protein
MGRISWTATLGPCAPNQKKKRVKYNDLDGQSRRLGLCVATEKQMSEVTRASLRLVGLRAIVCGFLMRQGRYQT